VPRSNHKHVFIHSFRLLRNHLRLTHRALSDWVGSAAAGSVETVQRAVVEKAFGPNAARSVPEMGRFSFDDHAREAVGATIIKVRHLGGGFKGLIHGTT